MKKLRAVLALSVALLALAPAAGAGAATIEALSPADTQLYAAAFDAVDRGDFTTADSSLAKVKDPCLVGRVEFLKLTHPATTGVSYADLVGWLKAFKDLPGADKIYGLALKLMPPGAEPPPPETTPVAVSGSDHARASAQSHAAREAFFDGDLRRALSLARSSGDAWITGLADYRLHDFAGAMAAFETVARNTGEDDWARAGGAFWAARSADALGQPGRAQDFLHIAASLPDTFYGLIAARRLQLAADPLGKVIDQVMPEDAPAAPLMTKVSATGFDSPAVIQLVQTDARARRAVALMQIGRSVDAGVELRAGLAMAQDDDERAAWTTLVFALNPNRQPGAKIAAGPPPTSGSGVFYAQPELTPLGGYTVNKALVYAVTWQESRFDSLAVSPVGAIGLMQVMPASAASVAGDDSLKSDPTPLFDPATNLRVGQDYLTWLMAHCARGDLMRAIAAYNGGPSTLARTEAVVGPDADTLMVVESLPFAETRAYVHKVMAAYWTYQRRFGGPAVTLDAAASGAQVIDARLDR